MKPRYRAAGGLQQVRYNLPYDIHSSTVYPLTSLNGSSIILCGHSQGLLVLWRGGRPLKSVPESQPDGGADSQDIMTIDYSDEEQSTTKLGLVEFEDQEDEFDPRHPYLHIVQQLNLPLGTGVLHIAVPRISEGGRQHLSPSLLQDKMLIALGCADASVRVLLLPMAPPTEASKNRRVLANKPSLAILGNGMWGEQLIEIPRAMGHRLLPDSISLAVADRKLVLESGEQDMDSDGDNPRQGFDVLLASCSADAGGALLIHRVPVAEDGSSLAEEGTEVWKNLFLDTPGTSLDLYFGPLAISQRPKLLVSEAEGPVRIYEFGSEETKEDGRWTLSLEPTTNETRQRRLLSVKLILGATAVLALMSDGEWGVWDLSMFTDLISTPVSSKQTQLSYGGWLANPSANSKVSKSTDDKPSRAAAFAPVTPHTRKVRQHALFAGDETSASNGSASANASAVIKGGISITKTSQESGAADDGSALVWYGERTILIPSLRAHHNSRLSASGTGSSDPSSAVMSLRGPFGAAASAAAGQVKHVAVPDRATLLGGAQVGGAVLNAAGPASVRNRVPEVLFASERAVSIVGAPKTGGDDGASGSAAGTAREGTAPQQGTGAAGLKGLLRRGELSIEGVEGMLDRMAGGVMRLSGRA